MIFLVVLLLASFGHGFLWVGLVNRIHAWAGPRLVIDLLTLFCVLAFAGIPLAIAYAWLEWCLGGETWGFAGPFSPNQAVSSVLQPAIWKATYLDLCAVLGGGTILWRLLGPRRVDPPNTLLNRQVHRLDLASMSCQPLPVDRLARLLNLVPANQMLDLSVEKKQIALPRLHKSYQGLSILHISDLHMTGRIDCEFFRLVANEVNALQPDIIALTGDILENRACYPWLAESLGRMQARFGKYFILGNHDHFADFSKTRRLLSELGWIDVGGCWLPVSCLGTSAVVGGNELPWFSPAADLAADHPDLPNDPSATMGANSALRSEGELFRIVLTHSPDQFPWCCRCHADLVLAGHTHGGQICLPLLGPVACPSRYGTRYAGGVYRKEGTVMHVSRGISGEFPIRWNCPPEIALLELVQG